MTLMTMVMLVTVCAMATPLHVASYNIRYDSYDDSVAGNGWRQRCPQVCSIINYEQPDVFGAQEVLDHQLHDMLSRLPDYAYVGVGRDDGDKQGEYAAIFYRTDRFDLLDSGHFWLSETPNHPGLGWDAACVRICTWAHLQDRSSHREVLFMNLHMDHVGTVARRESARLVVERVREMAAGKTVILTGDFNVDQTDEIYQIFTTSGCLKDSYEAAQVRLAPYGTFNDWNTREVSTSRIDHVFVSPSVQVCRYAIMTNVYWDARGQLRLPSDHYPVFVKLEY